MTAAQRNHPDCWTSTEYAHSCQRPSGRTCLDCDQPAGTLWGPYWCPEHDVRRLDRISASLESIAADLRSDR